MLESSSLELSDYARSAVTPKSKSRAQSGFKVMGASGGPATGGLQITHQTQEEHQERVASRPSAPYEMTINVAPATNA